MQIYGINNEKSNGNDIFYINQLLIICLWKRFLDTYFCQAYLFAYYYNFIIQFLISFFVFFLLLSKLNITLSMSFY